jgi:ADP-heptose:LPS heptosyltransferase
LRSTSCKQIAQELLDRCLAGNAPPDLPRALLEEPCGKALFGVLVEGLADRFEPALCDVYARLFSQAVAHVASESAVAESAVGKSAVVPGRDRDGAVAAGVGAGAGLDAASLVARYERVRRPRPILQEARRVVVFSRVTLGADVAITSVFLAAAKKRFPRAEVLFVGPKKNYELFAGDARIRHCSVAYPCGGLRDRLAVWQELKNLALAPDCVAIDPDSRLTQLGLLPLGAEERYHLFESRSYGGETGRTLPELAAQWAATTFGVAGAKPYVALGRNLKPAAWIAVSLGVGENPDKRIPDPFEERLLALLADTGQTLFLDKGTGGEEAARVERAVERSGVKAKFWEGSFAGFARIIARSRLYAGYDSAGQHVAAACGVPLISIFAGFPAPRMFDRWKPISAHSTVIRVDRPDPADTLDRVRQALHGEPHAGLLSGAKFRSLIGAKKSI